MGSSRLGASDVARAYSENVRGVGKTVDLSLIVDRERKRGALHGQARVGEARKIVGHT